VTTALLCTRDRTARPHDPNGIVIGALRTACPSFAGPWLDHVGSFSGGIGPYVDAGAFANHLVDLLESDATSEFHAVFEAVERLLVEGDDGIKYLVAFGLIEDLQNISSNRHGWPFAARFGPWLRPATMKAWDEVHDLWGTSDLGSRSRKPGDIPAR
jgi:hypothetical protein